MKHRVRIEVPLSAINDNGEIQPDTFTIEPPCFYCGKPITSTSDGYFSLGGDYNIKFWGHVQDTLKPKLGNVIDAHGNFVKGKYEVQIPYCPEHIKPVRVCTIIDYLAIMSGIILGIGLMAFFGVDIFSGTLLTIAFILIPILTAGVFYGLGTGIKSILPKLSPRLKDYAIRNGHYGICSHGVRIDGGKEMEGPITYWLKLSFCRPEGAQRFLEYNPGAVVVKGKRLLEKV